MRIKKVLGLKKQKRGCSKLVKVLEYFDLIV
jgi:hypothetical protein